MIKVLHVIDSLDLGGAQTVLVNLARFRDRAQVEMTVAAMHGRGVFAPALEAEGVEVASLSGGKFPPAYFVRLPCLLRRRPFDVVHFHLFGSNAIGKPLAAASGTRVRINHDHCNDRARSGWRLALDRLTNRLSTHVLAVSRSTRNDLIMRVGLPEERVTYLANGVDTEYFSPFEGAERAGARVALGLPAEGLVVAGLGRLHPQKNWPVFLAVARRFPQVEFVLAGTGPEDPALRAAAPENVKFLGFCEARTVLAAADIFLLTSDYEGMPMTLLEAMSCGLPCVVSAVDGCAEILGDGVGGATARPGEVEDFVRALEPLVADRDRRVAVGAEGREKVLRSYDARVQTRTVEDLYRRLLGR